MVHLNVLARYCVQVMFSGAENFFFFQGEVPVLILYNVATNSICNETDF